ncbi:class I adenylate-forming enzyme family protein [Rhodococcus jostii]|uniref:AMP-binding protein n=1 Tax=Rhodococcus jostii TaxID=132919 RepID=A0ABU4CQJ0_RHOJO|nr:AMP-binding protein [Rhodococcus jostii]MDV6285830.1 AMP-binding protein [Rhodococcus jostii]
MTPAPPVGFGRLVLDTLDRTPDLTALRQGDLALTYAQAHEHVISVAARLSELGLRPGETLLQIRGNDMWQWVLAAACAVAGVRSCSIPPSLPAGELSRRVTEVAPSLVVTDGPWVAPGVRMVSLADVLQPTTALAPDEADAYRIVRLALTSGTGGTPKGVDLSGAAMAAVAEACADAIPWPARPTVVCAEAVSGGFGNMVLPTLMHGGTVVLPGPDDTLPGVLDAYPGAVLLVMPPTLRALLAYPEPPAAPPTLVVYSGDVLTHGEIDRVHRWAGPVLCGVYGQVEVPKTIAISLPEDHLLPHRAGTLGRPFTGTDWRVVDLDGNDVPAGQPGELWVRSATVMSGYAFPDTARSPFAGDWLRTGDICRVVDGYAIHDGRIEDVLAHRPAVICPGPLERRLDTAPVALLPGRADGAVVAVTTSAADTDSIRGPLAASGLTLERLVEVDDIPRTWMGRIDRRHLRSLI